MRHLAATGGPLRIVTACVTALCICIDANRSLPRTGSTDAHTTENARHVSTGSFVTSSADSVHSSNVTRCLRFPADMALAVGIALPGNDRDV